MSGVAFGECEFDELRVVVSLRSRTNSESLSLSLSFSLSLSLSLSFEWPRLNLLRKAFMASRPRCGRDDEERISEI